MKRLQLIALAMIAGSISCTLRASEASRSLSTLHLKIINTGTNPTGVLTVDFHDPTCYRDPLNALYSPCTDGKQAFFIDSDTSFTLKREMPWRQDIRIGVGARMDTHHAVLLSAPGDSASLTLDFGKICDNDDTGFVFGGKQGSLNAQINACEKYLSQRSGSPGIRPPTGCIRKKRRKCKIRWPVTARAPNYPKQRKSGPGKAFRRGCISSSERRWASTK